MTFLRRLVAEFVGTFWLVFAGCGSAVLAGGPGGIGLLGISLAFGLAVLTMAYALGPISGAHLNPAVSLGLVLAGRLPPRDLAGYVGAQVGGATLGAWLLRLIATHRPGGPPVDLAANGFAAHSPGSYGVVSAFVLELVLTWVFVLVILAVTDRRVSEGFAPIAIGLCLTLIHLVGIPVTNLSVNPARSTGTALMSSPWAFDQLWLFWAAPAVGAALGALLYQALWASPVDRAARLPKARPA